MFARLWSFPVFLGDKRRIYDFIAWEVFNGLSRWLRRKIAYRECPSGDHMLVGRKESTDLEFLDRPIDHDVRTAKHRRVGAERKFLVLQHAPWEGQDQGALVVPLDVRLCVQERLRRLKICRISVVDNIYRTQRVMWKCISDEESLKRITIHLWVHPEIP